jgi:NADPH:quinone reductase
MRIIRYHEHGSPEVLKLEPGTGQVLVRAEAIGVNFVETQRRRGQSPLPSPLPASPAGDVVGIIEAIGPQVDRLRVGDRVAAVAFDGAYADFAVAESAWLEPIPHGLDAAQASVLASPAQTALCVVNTARIQPGDTVLVHAGAGTIGHLALQLAKLAGAGTVIATASTPEKLAFARSYGADFAVDYSEADWPDRVREAVGPVDVILDSIGGAITAHGIELLAPFGRLVSFGSAGSGPAMPTVSTMDLIDMKYVVGARLNAWWAYRPEETRRGLRTLIEHVRNGKLRTAVHANLPLEQAASAHRIIEDRAQLGRVLLAP